MADPAREIENLLYTYAERIDAGDLEGVAGLFARGRIATSADAPPELTFEGRDRVLGLYRASTRIYEDGSPHTKHVTSNPIIEVDGAAKAASARSYYTVFQQVHDLPLQRCSPSSLGATTTPSSASTNAGGSTPGSFSSISSEI